MILLFKGKHSWLQIQRSSLKSWSHLFSFIGNIVGITEIWKYNFRIQSQLCLPLDCQKRFFQAKKNCTTKAFQTVYRYALFNLHWKGFEFPALSSLDYFCRRLCEFSEMYGNEMVHTKYLCDVYWLGNHDMRLLRRAGCFSRSSLKLGTSFRMDNLIPYLHH